MTLLIACILIYNFNMEWWWYAIVGATWIAHTFPVLGSIRRLLH